MVGSPTGERKHLTLRVVNDCSRPPAGAKTCVSGPAAWAFGWREAMNRRPVVRSTAQVARASSLQMRAAQMMVAVGVLAAIAALLAAASARAEEIRMAPTPSPVGVTTPPRGMTMDKVRAGYGQPVDQRAAVGDPPITRWEYDGFVVYFEYQYVLHSVVKRGR